MLESYIRTGDGKDYVDVDCIREALGIKEDEDVFLAIKRERDLHRTEIDNLKDNIRIKNNALKTVKKERDELKDQVRRLRIQANSVYSASCGYSEYTGDKAPAFRCNVISYSWNFGALDTPFSIQSIRVELSLTPTASYKGTIDMEDLKRYIQNYGREKKLGIVESIDYQNAKAARAELAYLYKQVLGKEKLDRDLSPHEVMKAILDEYDKREDFIRELSCSLGFGNPVVKPDNIDQKEKDILERIESLKSGVWPCENTSTFAEHLRKEFPKFCKKYNVVPLTDASIHDWIQYIFDVLSKWRGKYDFVEDSLSELRAKIREIYRSVVDDEWDESLSYTSALNDINEEYKRVVHNNDNLIACVKHLRTDYNTLTKDLWELRKNAIEDLKSRGFCFRPEENETLPEIYDKLLKRYDWAYGMYEEQSRLRQQWHSRYDSEHKRANGEYKRAEKLKNDVKCWTKSCDSLQTALNNSQNDGVALQAFRNECKKLREEKTKVITALGQDIWDDCVK